MMSSRLNYADMFDPFQISSDLMAEINHPATPYLDLPSSGVPDPRLMHHVNPVLERLAPPRANALHAASGHEYEQSSFIA